MKPALQLFKYAIRRMCSQSNNPIVAVCQFTAKSDKETNFQTCKALIQNAKDEGATMVFLPECYDFIGESRAQSYELAEPIDGNLINRYRDLAKDLKVWLSLGGGHEKVEFSSEKMFNSHVVINSSGCIVDIYRKTHLFAVDIPGRVRLKESDFTIPGNVINQPVDTPIGKIGLGTCYDLRFAEFSTCLSKMGADVLTYPSAFTFTTGQAHWQALLRARAIENQTYVIAAAQFGQHNAKRKSFGQAMIVDPWGKVVACCEDGTNVATAQIDLSYLHKVREEMPVFKHRRDDVYTSVYPLSTNCNSDDFSSRKIYDFGGIRITGDQLFYRTRLSMAFVNLKPILPGHVLVSPLRRVERLSLLKPEEINDLFLTVQTVEAEIEKYFNGTSSTVAIQDGKEAGQSVEHVHVHIVPRHKDDLLNNDDIYQHLQNHDKEGVRQARSRQTMAEEASRLRSIFHLNLS